MIDRWLGLGVLLAGVIAAPFIGAWLVRIYPKTPVGRAMLLRDDPVIVTPPPVHIGQQGRAMTTLRPSGEVEFENERLEVISEGPIIPSGKPVKVVAINNGRAVVREVEG